MIHTREKVTVEKLGRLKQTLLEFASSVIFGQAYSYDRSLSCWRGKPTWLAIARKEYRMKRPTTILLFAMLVCLLAPGTIVAWRTPDIAPARDLDIRGPLPNVLPQAAAPLRASDQANALSSLQGSVQKLSIRWSALTGAPSRIDPPAQPLTGPSLAPARDIAVNFLSQNLSLFNLSSQDVSETRFSRNFTSSYNGVTHLTIQQQINGIDVFGGPSAQRIRRTHAHCSCQHKHPDTLAYA